MDVKVEEYCGGDEFYRREALAEHGVQNTLVHCNTRVADDTGPPH